MKDTGKQSHTDRLAEAMAASAVSCANGASSASGQTSWQRRGNGEASDTCQTQDMGRNTVQEKTLEFFQMCDIENKGFITRRDMQRLNGGLPLSAEELENVFETLDSDGNGFLTLHEFSSGFSDFLFGQDVSGEEGSKMREAPACKTKAEVLYQTQWEDGLRQRDEDEEEEEHFSRLMESLGANSVFENPAEVRNLWAQLRRDEPHLLSNFEDFLARVTSQIIEANQEKMEIESALRRKAATHDDEIQHLYEEMEQQIKTEKDKIVLQDHERFLSRCQEMELQLLGKEKEMEQVFQKQRRLEQKYQELHSEQHMTKVENVKLKQSNDELAQELDHTSQELTLAQDQLSILQEQATRLHEEKEMEIYRLTEGLQRERAGLLKQLDLLREMNKNLRDESDMCFQTPKKTPVLMQQPSISTPQHINADVLTSDEEEQTISPARQNLGEKLSQSTRIRQKKVHLPRIISIEEDHLPQLLQDYQLAQSPIQECSETLTSLRGQPVGKESSIADESAPSLPDRLFKVVLVGNSSVGKTSFLRRFCDESFHPGICATVGIDYSVKTITVDSSQVALQMWDTAGQERYRSITKQFFRKADGVIVMFDITDEQSFTAVRQWLTSIKESAGEDIPIMLLGNKIDKQLERQVQHETGQRLAKESQMAFFECSAYSGCNVMESMVHLARILKEQEDKVKEKTVQLVGSSSEQKKSCC